MVANAEVNPKTYNVDLEKVLTNEKSHLDFTPKKYPTTVKSVCKCVLNFIITIPTALFHLSLAMILCVLINIIPIPTAYRHRLLRNVKVYVEQIANTLLGLWFNKTFYASIDSRLLSKVCELNNQDKFPRLLTISNHISEIDWLFIKVLAEKLNFLRYLYIVMKQAISEYQIIGFLLKSFGHTFVARKRSDVKKERRSDIALINSLGNDLIGNPDESRKSSSSLKSGYFSKLLTKYGLMPSEPGAVGLVFPEGTTFTKTTYDRTLDYYKNNNLEEEGIEKPKYVLVPKSLGFSALMGKISNSLDGICDTTLLTLPFSPSTYDCISFIDILLCKAPPISFCMILDYLEVPLELKKLSEKLPENAFEYPELLNENEKKFQKESDKILYESFSKKDKLIRNYVEGSTRGNFESQEDFENFMRENNEFNQKREIISMKIDSPYKNWIFFIPALFFTLITLYYFRNSEFVINLLFNKPPVSTLRESNN